ncbi:MAG TPA: DUF948 domain-containing protein [Methylomirabilota bacterium]|jgi:uncharacterized protein YoxC|nr:DUF948 domain-containing protein [Methylomirabilota bacterium]
MTPLAQALVVACIVVLTAVLVSTLLALRKTALRAESVLHIVERELEPMATQIESLAGELRTLSHHVDAELERVGIVVHRLEEVTTKAARLIGALAGLTRVGQYAGVAAGVKKGLDVFIRRFRDHRR